MLFKPVKGVTALFGHESIRLDGKGPGFIPQDNWDNPSTRHLAATGSGVEVGYQHYTQEKNWFQVDADVGIGTLTVMPAWQRARGELYRKNDQSRPPGSNEQWKLDPQLASQDSLEVRLGSKPGSALTWVVGYYGYKMATGSYCYVNCGGANPNNASTDSAAAISNAASRGKA